MTRQASDKYHKKSEEKIQKSLVIGIKIVQKKKKKRKYGRERCKNLS